MRGPRPFSRRPGFEYTVAATPARLRTRSTYQDEPAETTQSFQPARRRCAAEAPRSGSGWLAASSSSSCCSSVGANAKYAAMALEMRDPALPIPGEIVRRIRGHITFGQQRIKIFVSDRTVVVRKEDLMNFLIVIQFQSSSHVRD